MKGFGSSVVSSQSQELLAQYHQWTPLLSCVLVMQFPRALACLHCSLDLVTLLRAVVCNLDVLLHPQAVTC